MKTIALVSAYMSTPVARRNVRLVVRLVVVLVIVVALYSALFHVLMNREGRSFSWATSVYWTLVTMSTVGFGDITFQSDAGRLFSVLVLLSGGAFILVLLPFAFIQFVFVPVMEARQAARAPRQLPPSVTGHVILTGVGPIEDALIRRLHGTGTPYVVVVSNLEQALGLHDAGYQVMVGDLDDPRAYRAARVEQAALVVTTLADTANTNVAFTVREINESVLIVATANSPDSVDILELAGCDQVLQLGPLLGSALAQRVLGPDGHSQVIGRFGDLLVAEAVAPAALVGGALKASDLRRRLGTSVVGVWHRGEFELASPETVIRATSVLVLAGSRQELDAYQGAYGESGDLPGPVIIVGAGRVGRATAAALQREGIDCKLVERDPARIRDPQTYVLGDAADLAVLQRAGISEASSVVITTHDDNINVYLTIYCRRLRPDVQIIGRANLDRNVSTLHRAGADFVLSYASTGATAVWNMLTADNTLHVSEGLHVFRVPVPPSYAGRSLADSGIRESTGCNVVAVLRDGGVDSKLDPHAPLPADGELVLIGDTDSERRFLAHLPDGGQRRRERGRPLARPPSRGSPPG